MGARVHLMLDPGEAEAAGEDPGGAHQGPCGERPPPLPGLGHEQTRLEDPMGGVEHVPEDEQQDPRRQDGQEGARALAQALDAADRQSEEDGEAGDRAEDRRTLWTHVLIRSGGAGVAQAIRA
jgi:hypothetical protein